MNTVKLKGVQKMLDFKGRQRKYTLLILAKFANLEKRGDITNFPEGNLPNLHGQWKAG